ncbi:cupin domain-containing protein [Anaerotalea alkaliphila]|uniref:Helix-turn-helix domain-containing protein n=1 Tax=Anaerotalea alkaliphila TaxID=2662126 RepID=A0A7X5HVM9_9FIRM|nr:cupin domain-containing protein [Anaerotalea alkaliphila]NDL67505.1 helix-turn-helix domain-containing protein [Anaerotalea alkaliphila]
MPNINEDSLSLALGQKIRETRKAKDLKIADLARMTGLTVSMISQVERGIISPSIETLKKIGNAMEIPLSYLFENGEGATPQIPTGEAGIQQVQAATHRAPSPVVHPHQRKMMSPGKGVRFYLLNPNLKGEIEFIYNEYEPGSGTGSSLYSHPGSECGLILTGELVVQINEDIHVLKAGDSITFNSTDPHAKRNESDELCTCVWANVPPWF